MDKVDWREIALRQRIRAEASERQAADLKHAMNLLVNESVDWYASYHTPDGQTHKFGIGVAANVEIRDHERAAIAGRKSEHRVIVFWLSELPCEDGDPAKYVTVYTMDEFKALPAAVKQNPEIADLSDLLQKAAQGLDEAHANYFKHRVVGGRLM